MNIIYIRYKYISICSFIYIFQVNTCSDVLLAFSSLGTRIIHMLNLLFLPIIFGIFSKYLIFKFILYFYLKSFLSASISLETFV